MENYLIPLGIDGTNFFSTLDRADKQLSDLSNSAQNAGKGITTTMTAVTSAANDAAQSLGAGASGAKVLSDAMNDTTTKATSLRTQLRQMKQDLAEMELAGKTGTAQFQAMSKQAGALALQIQVTQKRVKDLATETKGLEAGVSAVRGLAGAFAVAEGISAAFGSENEQLAESLKKVEGAMAILIGVQEVAEVLKKDSALRVVLESIAYKENTAAIAAETVALGAETAATEGATVATNEFTAALLINPIFLIVAAIVAAGVALYEFSQIGKIAKDTTKDLNSELDSNQKLLDLDTDALKRRTDLSTAQAQLTGENQSVITKITGQELEKQLELQEQALEKAREIENTAQNDHDVKFEDYKKFVAARIALEKSTADLSGQIAVKALEYKKQLIDEENKLELDLLHQKQANADALETIEQNAAKMSSQTQDLRIADMQDAQQKEIDAANKATQEKLNDLDKQAQIEKEKLEMQKQELALDINSDPAVLAKKKQGLADETKAEEAEAIKRAELRQQIQESGFIAEDNIRKKYEQAAVDYEHQTNLMRLANQVQDAETQKKTISDTADYDVAQVERAMQEKTIDTQDGVDRITQIYAKSANDQAVIDLQASNDKIDLLKLTNENIINTLGKLAGNSVASNEMKNQLILQNEANAAWQKVEILRQAGTDENTLVFQQAYAAALQAQAGLKAGQKGKTGKQSWAELLGFSGPDAQEVNQDIQDALKSTQSLIQSATQYIIQQYQQQIAAKKAVVQADDDALNTLESQLSQEQAARDKGYANNVTGIQQEIAAKSAQRVKDAADADAYQKKMEKVQKAQVIINKLEEASQLTLAIAKIWGGNAGTPVIGVALAAALTGVMIASFLAETFLAVGAVNSQAKPTTMGEGGWIDGPSHADGGTKYYNPNGAVTELEGGEHVTNKRSAQRYARILDAINTGNFTGLGDSDLAELLEGTGVSFGDNKEEGVKEARTNMSNSIMMLGREQKTPVELKSMDATMKAILKAENEKETSYEENGYLVKKKGNKTTRTRLKK